MLQLAADIVAGDLSQNAEVRDSVFRMWTGLLVAAWQAEELDVVDMVLTEFDEALERQEPSRELISFGIELGRVLLELAAMGLNLSGTRIAADQPWKKSHTRFGPLSRAEAQWLALNIRREVAMVGKVTTPAQTIVEELDRALAPLEQEVRERFSAKAASLTFRLLDNALRNLDPSDVTPIGDATVRLVLRTIAHRLPLQLPSRAFDVLSDAHRAALETGENANLREAILIASHELARQGLWDASLDLVEVSVRCTLSALQRATNPEQRLAILSDEVLSIALVHAWAELSGKHDQIPRLGHSLESLPIRIEALTRDSVRTLVLERGIKYRRWYQPLRSAAHALRDVPFREPDEIGFDLRKDHPSSLFRSWNRFDGPEVCVEHLVESVAGRRQLLVSKLHRDIRFLLSKTDQR